jgi:hypothetical protein
MKNVVLYSVLFRGKKHENNHVFQKDITVFAHDCRQSDNGRLDRYGHQSASTMEGSTLWEVFWESQEASR